MENEGLVLLVSAMLIMGNAFFVAAEYGLVGARRARLEGMARQKNTSAQMVLEALGDLQRYVAGIQIAITMFGIAIGAITEPLITRYISGWIGGTAGRGVSILLAVIFVTYVLVVVGELVPKYLTLQKSEKVTLILIRPLRVFVAVMTPLIWLVQRSGALVLLPFGIKVGQETEQVSREELILLVQAGSSEGMLDKVHAEMISRAFRLDTLDAKDIMIHRLDMRFLDLATPKEELLDRLAVIPHTRLPVCRDGDLDELVGVVYLHDIVRNWNQDPFSLGRILRPAVVVPENLSLNRIVQRMKEEKTQIVIVVDEYGGTSGLITLEDIVEEIFGELDDRLESERPPIQVYPSGRVSARAEVRFDELVSFLGVELAEDAATDTLATCIVNSLDRVPKIGDVVDTALGKLRVENMARRRITRVSLTLKPELRNP
jgi:putative hemolysin